MILKVYDMNDWRKIKYVQLTFRGTTHLDREEKYVSNPLALLLIIALSCNVTLREYRKK